MLDADEAPLTSQGCGLYIVGCHGPREAVYQLQRKRCSLLSGVMRERARRTAIHSAAKLETWLSVTPRPRELVLDSPGGFVLEARRIANLVEANGLDTRIDRECHSACVDVFAAGQIRTMQLGSVVGLHSAWSPVLTPEAGRAVDEANREFARRLYGRGIERRFLEVGIATPGSSMWVNSARQAHIAGLATRVVEQ